MITRYMKLMFSQFDLTLFHIPDISSDIYVHLGKKMLEFVNANFGVGLENQSIDALLEKDVPLNRLNVVDLGFYEMIREQKSNRRRKDCVVWIIINRFYYRKHQMSFPLYLLRISLLSEISQNPCTSSDITAKCEGFLDVCCNIIEY